MIEFWSTSAFLLEARGRVYVVTLDRDCGDFSWLIGQDVLLDGKRRHVTAVESYAHCPPWRRGEPISLLVEECKDVDRQGPLPLRLAGQDA